MKTILVQEAAAVSGAATGGPPGPPATLVEVLARRFADAHDRPAAVDALGGRQRTWGELAEASLRLAEAFEAAGLRAGDRLAHALPHGMEWIVLDFACLLAGIVHVALHADAGPREHDELLGWLAPRGLVVRRWTRLPYRSQGDAEAERYEHDDAVLVLERVSG